MPQQHYPVSDLTVPTRHKERVSYDRALAERVLDEALICHVGFVVDGRPIVLPQLHLRRGDHLYLHGSTGARSMRAARDGGLPVCVTVTLVDGLVLARAAAHHSINFRSVVVHGIATEVTDEAAKRDVLEALVGAIVPGRPEHSRGPSGKELAATTVLRVPLEHVSVKARTGPPADDAADLDLPYWAGVLPIRTVAGTPEPAPDLPDSITAPEHVTAWARGTLDAALPA